MPVTASDPSPALASLDQIGERLDQALARSPADETELVWLEARRRLVATGRGGGEPRDAAERTILVRVIERGRVGSHRTGSAEAGDLDNAVRAAIAQSRVRQPLPGLPHLPVGEGPVSELQGLHDPELAGLGPRRARELLGRLRRRSESARLEWSEASVAVFNNRGVRRQARVTAAAAAIRCGRGAGSGRAADAARSLAGLGLDGLFERARGRRAAGRAGEPPATPGMMVLSPEAAGRLCDLLNRTAFSADSYYRGDSFLREHLGVQVFDRAFSLRDDATDPAGLPFPFDLEGTPKQPVDLVAAGTPKTPALDQRQAAVLGLPPTAHAIGGADARAENLFLLPGPRGDDELLALADGGVWAGWIEPLECFDPTRVLVRAVLRGVRRIAGGKLGEALPDLVWETSLLRAFANLEGVGTAASRRLARDGFLGGLSAPSLALKTEPSELRVR